MESAEMRLKEIIVDRYGSLKKFCETIDMPWTTLDSILKRGIANSNITNVLKITKELKIDTESLATGIIIDAFQKSEDQPQTLTAHFDGDEYTEDELEEIKQFADFVKNKRKPLKAMKPVLNAAYARTDIEVTTADQQHDEDIMDDENF